MAGRQRKGEKAAASVAVIKELTGIDITTTPLDTERDANGHYKIPARRPLKLDAGEAPDCERGDYPVVATVCISCRFCGFNIGENRADHVKDGLLTCESCGGTFKVPASAIHDAQHACLIALGEA